MLSPLSACKRSFLLVAVALGCQFEALAATSVTACDERMQTTAAAELTLVDYEKTRSSDAEPGLRDASAIDTKALILTPKVDTTVRRDDHVSSDLELPTDDAMDADPGAAALLLERRNARLREASDDAPAEMNTELPGMDQNEMLRFREQMYRTDI